MWLCRIHIVCKKSNLEQKWENFIKTANTQYIFYTQLLWAKSIKKYLISFCGLTAIIEMSFTILNTVWLNVWWSYWDFEMYTDRMRLYCCLCCRRITYEDLEDFSPMEGRETPFSLQLQIAEVIHQQRYKDLWLLWDVIVCLSFKLWKTFVTSYILFDLVYMPYNSSPSINVCL